MIKGLLLFFLLFILTSKGFCQAQNWRFEIALNDRLQLPFFIEINNKMETFVINGKEKIKLKVNIQGDSVVYQFKEMDSYLKFTFQDSNNIIGYWKNNRKGTSYPLTGTTKLKSRFEAAQSGPSKKVFSSYKVTFGPEKGSWPAIGLFEQNNNVISGTFLTETGDYRYLDGNVFGDRLYLSCFDGSHAFVFTAKINGDSLSGRFYSGGSYQTNWKAVKDENASIGDPNTLTYLVDKNYELSTMKFNTLFFGRKKINFKKHPITLIQIMGSWCPNCLDETNYFKTLHANYTDDGLQIIALGFESQKTNRGRKKHLRAFTKKARIPYKVFLAGKASKKAASQRFSMLNGISSFPTTLFVNRQGEIIHVHTGFNGPATGRVFEEYKKETESLIEAALLK
ncbi:TlpA family protein disulfide reductase [Crocinitomicaceae bacterium]|nr:TlpA family protein disulfide reductase [Crocinitomicaceae bacterium]